MILDEHGAPIIKAEDSPNEELLAYLKLRETQMRIAVAIKATLDAIVHAGKKGKGIKNEEAATVITGVVIEALLNRSDEPPAKGEMN